MGPVGGAEDEVLVEAPNDQEMSKDSPEEPPVPKAMVREAQPPSRAVPGRAWEVEDVDPPEGERKKRGCY